MKYFYPLLLLGAIAPCCLAQPMQARFTVGATVFADDGPVTETTVGGGVRFYFSRRWSLEPEFLYVSKKNDHSSILWGNVAFDFRHRDKKIVPYWYGGPGVVRHTSSFGQFSFTATEAGFGTGAGVRFMLSDRVFVAPQFRLGVADGVFSEATVSIGLVLKN